MAHNWNEIDFVITKVKTINGKISSVFIQKVNKDGGSLVAGCEVPRIFIANLLELNEDKKKNIIFYTAIKKNEGFVRGDEVVLYNRKFITTSGNKTEKDNLDSLPKLD